MANITEKPLEEIFVEFDSKYMPKDKKISGDVKYHMGICSEVKNELTTKKMELILLDNPSHLEAVDPLVIGKTKSSQFFADDKSGDKILSLMIHGDAGFSGQGVVYETFNLSHLPDYSTHGIIHIVVNNQIGFTTDPLKGRSSPYCTDVARIINAPIFHVNADDPEAVMHVCKIAAEWRSKYKEDVVIDLVCYRRYGHNELDEPMITHPSMYQYITKQKKVIQKYSEKLLSDKTIDQMWFEV